jgi:acetyl-CoA acetyltransferase
MIAPWINERCLILREVLGGLRSEGQSPVGQAGLRRAATAINELMRDRKSNEISDGEL